MYPTLKVLLETSTGDFVDVHYGHTPTDEGDIFTNTVRDKLVAYIKEHAAPFLSECGGHIAYRGLMHGQMEEDQLVATVKTVRQDRRRRDSGRGEQEIMLKTIKDLGLTATRTNSIFVTGDRSLANSFGETAIAIPLGEFKYSWSPLLRDATGSVTRLLSDPTAWVISKAGYDLSHDSSNAIRALHQMIVTDPVIGKMLKTAIADEAWIPASKGIAWYVSRTPEERTQHILNAMADLASNYHSEGIYETVSDAETFYNPSEADVIAITTAFAHIAAEFVDKFKVWRGDDGSLSEALVTGNEVMIACDKYMLLERRRFEKKIAPKLGLS